MLVEALLLWETVDRQANRPAGAGVIARRMSRLQELLVFVLLFSWLAIFLADRFAPPLSLQQQSAIESVLLFLLFSFLFVFGLVLPVLLPRVNEQTIFVVSLLTTYILWMKGLLSGVGWVLLLLPLAGLFWMAWTTRILSPYLKSGLYLWYLFCLLVISLQADFAVFYGETRLQVFDYFLGGAAALFLLLHSVFLIRFFLMLTALFLPANRPLLALTMPKLFDDRQISRPQWLGLLALFVGILVLNRLTGLLPSFTAFNLLFLLAVHFLERPFPILQRW